MAGVARSLNQSDSFEYSWVWVSHIVLLASWGVFFTQYSTVAMLAASIAIIATTVLSIRLRQHHLKQKTGSAKTRQLLSSAEIPHRIRTIKIALRDLLVESEKKLLAVKSTWDDAFRRLTISMARARMLPRALDARLQTSWTPQNMLSGIPNRRLQKPVYGKRPIRSHPGFCSVYER